ncbi:MAG: prepilin-type N-terminal cleavage/methylation domain-containing protein [Candidatus Hydrogenedentes bacterium]|nr:prepilin-type N-terminal cleavage/methylation domain-containing protein [Candidatus Hydrogenedentota bacterium]
MHGEYRESRAGFTLVEVLVVLAIVALVSAIAIPGLAKMGAFSRDEFKRATQEVNSVLRAAQLYATTYNVNTAVVYSMDNYSQEEATLADTLPVADPSDEDPGDPFRAVASPIVDSLTGIPVRQIEAAAIMYQLPSTMGANLRDKFVPIPGDLGEFRPLPQGMSIALQSPEPENIDTTNPSNPVYGALYSEFGWSNYRSTATINRVGDGGMKRITAALGLPPALTGGELFTLATNPANYTEENFPAHVFRSSGRLDSPQFGFECGSGANCARERYSLFITPSADRPLDERLVQPENPDLSYLDSNGVEQSNLRYREIHIFKSTGRIAIPQDF